MPALVPNFRGSYASNNLPNVSGSTTQDRSIRYGDWAFDTDLGEEVICKNPTLGAAVWTTVGGGGGGIPTTPRIGPFGDTDNFSRTDSGLYGSTGGFSALAGFTLLRRPTDGNFRGIFGADTNFSDGWLLAIDSTTIQARCGNQASSFASISAAPNSPTSLISMVVGITYVESGGAGTGVTTLYVNGTICSQANTGTYATPTGAAVTMGAIDGAFNGMDLGYAFGFAYHTSVLSQSDFEKHYQACLESNTFADADGFSFDHYWPVVSGQGSTLLDQGAIGGKDFSRNGSVPTEDKVLNWW